MSLTEDLKYPFNEDEWYKTIGIGMVCEYFSWLIAPFLLLIGYYVRVMQHTAAGHEEPPTFEEPGELLGKGLKAFVVLVGYLLIPTAVSFVVTVPALMAILNGDAGAGLGGLLFGFLLSSVLLLVFSYGGMAGMVQFSHTESITSAFNPRLFGVITTVAWVKAWMKVLVTALLAIFVSGIIAIIPGAILTHVVLIPFQVKYFSTVYARVFANGYAEATGSSEPAPETATAPATS